MNRKYALQILDQYRYETTWCIECGEECYLKVIDEGLAPGHHVYEVVSYCCHQGFTENEPSKEELNG